MNSPEFLTQNTTSLVILFTAVAANLFTTAIFLFRILGRPDLERIIGMVFQFLAIPAIVALIGVGALWMRIYLGIFLAFLVMELILDYILKIPFRKNRRTLAPYLILYLLSFWGFIGILFTLNLYYGIIASCFYAVHTSVMIYYETGLRRGRYSALA